MAKSNTPSKKTTHKRSSDVVKKDSSSGKALNKKEKPRKETNSTGPRKK